MTKSRGYCCETGCTDCPYDFTQKINPEIPRELQNPWKKSPCDQEQELIEKYENEFLTNNRRH